MEKEESRHEEILMVLAKQIRKAPVSTIQQLDYSLIMFIIPLKAAEAGEKTHRERKKKVKRSMYD